MVYSLVALSRPKRRDIVRHMPQDASESSPRPATQTMDPNALALTYQPRRLRGALLSVAWNLAWLALFLYAGLADPTPQWLRSPSWPLYVVAFYALYAIINFPIDLWYGYLHERQFGLVKQGLRAWGRDWTIGALHHGIMFSIGSCLIVLLQIHTGSLWTLFAAAAFLLLFLASTFLAVDLLPSGLFQFEPADPSLASQLQNLIRPCNTPLPRILIFSHAEIRDFSGGIAGLGPRQALLISRPTIQLASNNTLRFVLLREMGHRCSHHLLLACLIAWVWTMIGLVAGDQIIRYTSPAVAGSPAYIPPFAFIFTSWMIASHPLLAYLGRRFEYLADRFYLRHGGTPDEMKLAIEELSRRDLARTDLTRPRQSIVQAMPTPVRRIQAAEHFFAKLAQRPLDNKETRTCCPSPGSSSD